MINSSDFSAKLALDSTNLDDLRLRAQRNPDQSLKEVTQQFEAIFIHMMLKSMREALPKDGIFNGQYTQFYTQMLDQQLAQKMSVTGIGLADMMIQQLSRVSTQSESNLERFELEDEAAGILNPGQQSATSLSEQAGVAQHQPESNDLRARQILEQQNDLVAFYQDKFSEPLAQINQKPAIPGHPENFVNAVMSHALIASEATGIPAQFMIAQAALESGWGKHEIRYADNRPSYNLFGIKAGESWKGAVVETVTTEYIDGAPKKVVEKFRAYNSYAEGFQDYANLLLNNPRYAAVLKNQDASSFANGLQKAGYATDPQYADKLIRIINSSSLSQNPTI